MSDTDEIKITADDMRLSHYDTADYLRDEEDIALYWDAVQEEASDDSASILRALAAISRARNMSELAKQAGLSRQGLYKALGPDGNPRYETVAKLAKALGLKLQLPYADAPKKAAAG